MTHGELVKAAAAWLRRQRCVVVLQDVRSWATNEQPDAIGWKGGGRGAIVVECKASASDYHRDRDKRFRREPRLGMGALRYYMAPSGLVPPWQVPKPWGLLEVGTDGKVRVASKPEVVPEWNRRAETSLLVDAVRRLVDGWGRQMFGLAPDGDAHPRPAAIIRELRAENAKLRQRLRTDGRPSVAASAEKP